jgi:hypothetical protein
MAHVAARNIAAQIRGEAVRSHEAFGDMPAVCVMDAGNNGVIILADKMLPPRKHGVLIPGPQAHTMKLGFEKYFLWKGPPRLRPPPLKVPGWDQDPGPARLPRRAVPAGPGRRPDAVPGMRRAVTH